MTREEILRSMECVLESDKRTIKNPISEYGWLFDKIYKWKKSLEQEPCENCISRQAAEKITWEESSYIDPINALTEVREKIRALPSVTPQPKMGRWIRVDKNKLRCSKCEIIHLIAQYPHGKIDWCPNCGAKMVEPQESEE